MSFLGIFIRGLKNSYLLTAAADGNSGKVDALLESGADVNAKVLGGKTPLIWAAARGHTNPVHALLGAGADVDAGEHDGKTALIWAAARGHSEVARMLLDAGANVNGKEHNGKTALMNAAEFGNTKIVEILLAAGADLDARDNHGFTAFSLALGKGYLHIMHLLWEAEQHSTFRKNGNSKSTEANIVLVRRLIEEVFPGDINRLGEFIAEDYIDHSKWKTRDGLKKVLSDVQAAYHEVRFSVEDTIAEADKVALRVRLTGSTGNGHLKNYHFISLYRVADGKIAEHWGHSDTFF